MRILLTVGARRRLERVLALEKAKNPDSVFRIWETTFGRYNDARILLRLSLDLAGEDDEMAYCNNLAFVASREFLETRGEPHIFCILMNNDGMPGVIEFGY